MNVSFLICHRFLEATVSGLHPTQPPSVRISAVRAVFGFCEHLKSSESTQLITPHLATIMDGLICTATQFSSEVLALCMETLAVVIGVSYWNFLFADSVASYLY